MKPLNAVKLNKMPRRDFGLAGIPLHYYAIAANGSFYLLWHSKLVSQETLMKHFFTNRRNIVNKRYYTYYTSSFAHTNILHLLANCAGLYMLSGPLEMAFGSQVFWHLHVLGGLAGGWYSHQTTGKNTGRSTIGASASICAHLAFFIMNYPNAMFYIFPIPFAVPGWMLGIGFGAYSYYQRNNPNTIISHSGHLGGFVAGLVYYYLWKNKLI
jgi:membrane associated rhomboid family serine protease